MRRKIVQQGKGALTVTIPRKWADKFNIKSGDDIFLREDDRCIIIDPNEASEIKKTSITLEPDTPETYRSLIGGLYRGGYDEIRVKLSESSNIAQLQKAVDSLYGFEIFDITGKSCTIKNICMGTATDIKSHIIKSIHIIKTMQDTIISNIKIRDNIEEVKEYRNNILKQRDIVIRLIHKEKLISNSHLPFYTISLSLWGVARNYYIMYSNLKAAPEDSDIAILKDTMEYFNLSFSKLSLQVKDFVERNEYYKNIRKKAINHLNKNPSLVISHCLSITLSIQLADSSLYLLNHKK